METGRRDRNLCVIESAPFYRPLEAVAIHVVADSIALLYPEFGQPELKSFQAGIPVFAGVCADPLDTGQMPCHGLKVFPDGHGCPPRETEVVKEPPVQIIVVLLLGDGRIELT